MKKIVKKIISGIKLAGALFYFFRCRIQYRNRKAGVAQVVDSFHSGGLEQVAANVYRAFKDNGDPSTVISVRNHLGPMVQQLDSPKEFRVIKRDAADFIRFCAKNNIKVLVFHFTTYHMILTRFLGFRNYYVIHNTYLWYTEKEWSHLKIKLRFCRGIIAVSEWCKDYFMKKTGFGNIKVILNGINFDNLYSGSKTSITREGLGIEGDEAVCLTLGGFVSGKHQMSLIGIAEEVIKVNDKIKFICAGPVLDEELYSLFLVNVEASQAKDNIIVLEPVPQEEIGSFISRNCDIYLQPSIYEAGVPLTVMEAVLKGKPVVMTDFLLDRTFPDTSDIFGIKPPYDDVLTLTTSFADEMARKTRTTSTSAFADQILEMAGRLEFYGRRDEAPEKYAFLSSRRMAEEYISYIKL